MGASSDAADAAGDDGGYANGGMGMGMGGDGNAGGSSGGSDGVSVSTNAPASTAAPTKTNPKAILSTAKASDAAPTTRSRTTTKNPKSILSTSSSSPPPATGDDSGGGGGGEGMGGAGIGGDGNTIDGGYGGASDIGDDTAVGETSTALPPTHDRGTPSCVRIDISIGSQEECKALHSKKTCKAAPNCKMIVTKSKPNPNPGGGGGAGTSGTTQIDDGTTDTAGQGGSVDSIEDPEESHSIRNALVLICVIGAIVIYPLRDKIAEKLGCAAGGKYARPNKPYVTYNKVMDEELSEALFVGDIDDSSDEEQTVFDRRRKGAYAD